MEWRYALRARGIDLDSAATRVSEVFKIKTVDIWAKGKNQRIVDARSLLCCWAVRELGVLWLWSTTGKSVLLTQFERDIAP